MSSTSSDPTERSSPPRGRRTAPLACRSRRKRKAEPRWRESDRGSRQPPRTRPPYPDISHPSLPGRPPKPPAAVCQLHLSTAGQILPARNNMVPSVTRAGPLGIGALVGHYTGRIPQVGLRTGCMVILVTHLLNQSDPDAGLWNPRPPSRAVFVSTATARPVGYLTGGTHCEHIEDTIRRISPHRA